MTERKQTQEVPGSVACSATKDPAVRLFIVAAGLIAVGVYCFVDAYVRKLYPIEDVKSISDRFTYYLNHYGAFVLIPPGLAALVWGVVFLRRRLAADEEGIGYLGKEKIAWDSIRSMDASELADKEILRLHYDADGTSKTLKLCSWKLQNFRSLVLLLENRVPRDAG